ncbi:hypothetical protein ABZ746_23730 [Streptomyces sp. NPDC020096]
MENFLREMESSVELCNEGPVDPSCGNGVFLTDAMDQLAEQDHAPERKPRLFFDAEDIALVTSIIARRLEARAA